MTELRQKMKDEMSLRGFSEGTQANYIRAIAGLSGYYHRSPAKLTEQEIKKYLLYLLRERKLARSTYNVIVCALDFFYRNVLHQEICTPHLPRSKQPSKLPNILTIAEITKIINALGNIKHQALLILIYGAGLRGAEAVNLKIGDIDSKRMLIHVRNGKGGKDRFTILSSVMLKILRRYWKIYRPVDWLFQGQKSNEALSSATAIKIYKRAKQKAGITRPTSIHSLRHAFATHLLEAGENIFTIQQLLGHSSIKSTTRYLRMSPRKYTDIISPAEKLNI